MILEGVREPSVQPPGAGKPAQPRQSTGRMLRSRVIAVSKHSDSRFILVLAKGKNHIHGTLGLQIKSFANMAKLPKLITAAQLPMQKSFSVFFSSYFPSLPQSHQGLHTDNTMPTTFVLRTR